MNNSTAPSLHEEELRELRDLQDLQRGCSMVAVWSAGVV